MILQGVYFWGRWVRWGGNSWQKEGDLKGTRERFPRRRNKNTYTRAIGEVFGTGDIYVYWNIYIKYIYIYLSKDYLTNDIGLCRYLSTSIDAHIAFGHVSVSSISICKYIFYLFIFLLSGVCYNI